MYPVHLPLLYVRVRM